MMYKRHAIYNMFITNQKYSRIYFDGNHIIESMAWFDDAFYDNGYFSKRHVAKKVTKTY